MRLQNKVILITAPTSDVCWELAQACAQEDGIIYMAVRDQQQGGEKAQIMTSRGMWVKSVYMDVRREETIPALTDFIAAEEGRIDVLVNYFGVDSPERDSDFEHTSFDTFMKLLRQNLAGVYLTSQAVIEPMRASGGGSIINLPSADGRNAYFSGIGYGASRAAVHFLTAELARQGSRSRIRCNAVLPCLPERERIARSYSPEFRPLHLRTPSVRRVGTPNEIAETVIYLASEEAAYTSGQLIETGSGHAFHGPGDRGFAEETKFM